MDMMNMTNQLQSLFDAVDPNLKVRFLWIPQFFTRTADRCFRPFEVRDFRRHSKPKTTDASRLLASHTDASCSCVKLSAAYVTMPGDNSHDLKLNSFLWWLDLHYPTTNTAFRSICLVVEEVFLKIIYILSVCHFPPRFSLG
jgi:hypothetical protein